MKKIAIATATRAEYGILHPLLVRLMEEKAFDVQLLVTGTHLEEQFGYTVKEIEKDGIPIARKIPILAEDNSPYGISVTMAQAITGFADYFRNGRPDLFLVLGDRTEILGMCAAALNEHIPIAHLHGGELTEGAVDDCIRHAVTKMSYLHFPATEVYRRRIIQMGEAPERVYNVGALGVENILSVPMLSEEEIRKDVEIPAGMPYAVVTFHPVTMQPGEAEQQVRELIAAMREEKQYFYLVTKANADAGEAGKCMACRGTERTYQYEVGQFAWNEALSECRKVCGVCAWQFFQRNHRGACAWHTDRKYRRPAERSADGRNRNRMYAGGWGNSGGNPADGTNATPAFVFIRGWKDIAKNCKDTERIFPHGLSALEKNIL